MKKIFPLFAFIMLAFAATAQLKVAILEPVDKAGNVSYGVKLLLRSSLTSAISNTDGYEGYDRVDMASIAGEQEFQRTGAVSDNQIKEIGRAAGASYVLVAEAAKYDATSIIITAKLLDVVTFGVKSSAVLVSGVSVDEMQRTCSSLASKLLNKPDSYANARSDASKKESVDVGQNAQLKESIEATVGSVITFPDKTRGIVFYMESGVGLAVSMDECQNTWSLENVNVIGIPDNKTFSDVFSAGEGKIYSEAIISELGQSNAPAVDWCVKHGEDWYLPSAGELSYLFKVDSKKRGKPISEALMRAGGFELVGGLNVYLSSSEYNKNNAVSVSRFQLRYCPKKIIMSRGRPHVRAIRIFSY